MSILRAYYTDLITARAFQDQMDTYTSNDPDFWISTYRDATHILLLVNGDETDHGLLSGQFIDAGVNDIRTQVHDSKEQAHINTAVNYYPNLIAFAFDPAIDIGDFITVIMRYLEPEAPALSYDNTPMPSGTFTDDFTGTDGALLEDRTGWALAKDGAYSAEITTNYLGMATNGGGSGASEWTCTDQGSSNQYVQALDVRFLTIYEGVFLCVRKSDSDNFIAYHLAGSGAAGARLCKRATGTLTDSIVTTQGGADYGFKIECEGTTVRFYRDTGGGFSQVGTDQTITDHQTETGAGFVYDDTSIGGLVRKFDDFENGTVGEAGGILPIIMNLRQQMH